MALGLFASFASVFFGWSMALLSLFLILLVLVQRGRGGGLTGALGGPGGQSAFGSKAGDMFTRITFVTAGIWIFLCAAAMWSLGNARSVTTTTSGSAVTESPGAARDGGETAPASGAAGSQAPEDIEELLNRAGQQPARAPAAPGEQTTPGEQAPATEPPAADDADAAVEEVPAEAAPAADAPAEVPAETPADEQSPAAEPSN